MITLRVMTAWTNAYQYVEVNGRDENFTNNSFGRTMRRWREGQMKGAVNRRPTRLSLLLLKARERALSMSIMEALVNKIEFGEMKHPRRCYEKGKLARCPQKVSFLNMESDGFVVRKLVLEYRISSKGLIVLTASFGLWTRGSRFLMSHIRWIRPPW